MKCDNCKQSVSQMQSKEWVQTRFKLAWPPIERVIIREMWCPQCYYGGTSQVGSVKPSLRRRYRIEDRTG